jgi:8-oxo-dGTP diphosphatase
MVLSEVRGGWEFPGGRIEQGESAEGAACREAREEAGAVVTNLTPLCRYRVKKHDVTSYGIVFLASVESRGEPSAVHEVSDVGLFSRPPEGLSFTDGFVELIFRLLGGDSS